MLKQLNTRFLMKPLTSWRAAQCSISITIHLTYILCILIMFSSTKDTLKIWVMWILVNNAFVSSFLQQVSIRNTKGKCFTHYMLFLCLFSMLYLNCPVKNKVRNDILCLPVYLPVMNRSEQKCEINLYM